MEIVAQMQTDFVVSGIAPYHLPETVLLLAFLGMLILQRFLWHRYIDNKFVFWGLPFPGL